MRTVFILASMFSASGNGRQGGTLILRGRAATVMEDRVPFLVESKLFFGPQTFLLLSVVDVDPETGYMSKGTRPSTTVAALPRRIKAPP